MPRSGLVVASIACLAAAAGCRQSANKVVVDESGFNPPTLTIARGQLATVEFTRKTDKTCAREVVFPELGITKDLPLDAPVAVALPAGEAKTYTFQCGMAMLKGSIVVQ